MILLKVKDEGNWEYLKKSIKDLGVFESHNYSDSFLKRRIEGRIRVSKLDTYSSYIRLLKRSSEERVKLKNDLTINVTHFFRDKSLYELLRKTVFPKLINDKHEKGERNIRIWSAGCSSGEEAYSVAILFKEILGEKLGLFDIDILGTDIDAKIVKRAKEGVYEKNQLRETDEDYVLKYFEERGDLYVIKNNIKNLVRFEEGDILSENNPRGLDIIFCRNTVIYFDESVKKDLYVDIHDLLNSGGLFILGKTEILVGPARETFKVLNSVERIYLKKNS